jgi:hypothetical protein
MLNLAQIKCLAVFAVFGVIGFGPISPGCLIGMYCVIMRPPWLLELVQQLYAGRVTLSEGYVVPNVTQLRIKCFLSLLTLFIIDILPVPVTPVIAYCIILIRPVWFYQVVTGIYGS